MPKTDDEKQPTNLLEAVWYVVTKFNSVILELRRLNDNLEKRWELDNEGS